MHRLEGSWTCRPGLILQILDSIHEGRGPIWRSDSPMVTKMKTHLPCRCHPVLAAAPLIDWTVTKRPPSFTEYFSWTVRACARLWGGGGGERKHSDPTPRDVNSLTEVLVTTFQEVKASGSHYKAWRKEFSDKKLSLTFYSRSYVNIRSIQAFRTMQPKIDFNSH